MSVSSMEKDDFTSESEIVVHGAASLINAKAGGRVATGFDPYAYLALNPDIYAAFGADVAMAISHYVNFGVAEERATDGFDVWSYLAFNPDLYNAFGANLGAAVAHYVQNGVNEERPLLGFNPYAYLALNPDLFAAFGADPAKALEHYVRNGFSEDRLTSGFDPYAYLAMNDDLYGAFGVDISAAISHYINNGAAEGRVTTGFDAYAYLAQNADLFAAFGADPAKAVQHYVQSGSREGGRAAAAPPVSATAPPTLSIAATSASKAEGNSGTTPFTFTVTRSGDTSVSTSVNWAVSGSAVTAADFTVGRLPSGAITFARGETSKAITVNVRGDATPESNEAFTVTLSSPSGAARLGTATATGTILNDDGAPPPVLSIAAANANQVEGNSGAKAFTFTVTRTGDLSKSSSVSWAAAGSGTNKASSADFSGATSGRLTFAANERSKTISVNVIGDTAVESDETFTVTLSGVTGATIGTAGATGTIRNDDSAPSPPTLSIAATSASKAEGNSGTTPFTFTVTRSGDTSVSTSVNWAVSGSAVTAADFTVGRLPSGAITFARGETSKAITVNVRGDATPESNEAFTVTLSSPSGAARLGTATATGTILNDDGAPPPVLSIAAANANQAEGNSGAKAFTFTVTRTGDLSKSSSVSWAAAGSGTNKASSADFSGATSGRLTFAANERSKTISVNVIGDTAYEQDETFTVTLSGPSGATLGTGSAVGTIRNDDTQTASGPIRLEQLPFSANLSASQGYNTRYSHGPDAESSFLVRGAPRSTIWSVDFGTGGRTGINALSVAAGTVVAVKSINDSGGFGNIITIRHDIGGRSFYATYAHLAAFSSVNSSTGLRTIQKDDAVVAGQVIGEIGNTGIAGMPIHLHLQFGTGFDGKRADGTNDVYPPVYFSSMATAAEGFTSSVNSIDIIGTSALGSGNAIERLFGTDADERIFGLGGSDILRGNNGNDQLYGGSGDDHLDGGFGLDTLSGGAGRDIFRFNAPTDGSDTITDFNSSDDRIEVVSQNFGNLAVGALPSTRFATNTASSADTRFVFKTTDNTLYYDPDGTGTQAATALAKLTNGATLTASNIFVVNA